MKILIIGNVGSGKTTLARKLSNLYDIPFFSIDSIVHDDSIQQKRTLKEQKNLINKINKENKDYILEGVLRKNLDFICNLVDVIVVLDLDMKILKRRIKKRYLKQKMGLEKADYVVNKETLNMMYKWLEEFDYSRLKEIIFKYHKKVIYLKNNKEVKKYLIALEKNG